MYSFTAGSFANMSLQVHTPSTRLLAPVPRPSTAPAAGGHGYWSCAAEAALRAGRDIGHSHDCVVWSCDGNINWDGCDRPR